MIRETRFARRDPGTTVRDGHRSPTADPLGLHPIGVVRAADGGWFERALADAIAGGAPTLEVDLRDVEFI